MSTAAIAIAEAEPEKAPEVWTPERSAAGAHNPWLVTYIIAAAIAMEVLDTSIANVALRNIAGSLGAGNDESTWVITSYLVANAVITPVSGWLSEVVGRKRFFILCIFLFAVSSLMCGMATSLSMLIVFRVLQGCGGGGMIPCGQAMIADSFPPNKRGMAFAMLGLGIVVAPAVGPPLGGWITDNYSWNWIFLINVPIGAAVLLLASVFLDEPAKLVTDRKRLWARGLRMDYLGFALVAIGLACLELTTSRGEQNDWFDSRMICVFASLCAVSLVALAFWEWRQSDPVVDVRLFRNKGFSACVITAFVMGFVFNASTVMLPQLLQGAHGYSALDAGMALMPGGAIMALSMLVIGVLSNYVQARYLLLAGALLEVIPLYYMSGFAPDLTYSHAAWARVFQSLALPMLFLPVLTLSYEGLSGDQTNMASSLMTVARNVGGSVGIAMITTWIAWRTQYHHSVLAEQISALNPNAANALAGLQERLEQLGAAPSVASQQAIVMLDGSANQQAAFMAFNDGFILMALTCSAILICFLFLPKNKPGASQVAAH